MNSTTYLNILIGLMIAMVVMLLSPLPLFWACLIMWDTIVVLGVVYETLHYPVDKQDVEETLKETRTLIDEYDFLKAQAKLLELSGRLKDKRGFKSELARTYNNLGITYNQVAQHQDINEAIKYFQLALHHDPNLMYAQINYAMALLNTGSDTEVPPV